MTLCHTEVTQPQSPDDADETQRHKAFHSHMKQQFTAVSDTDAVQTARVFDILTVKGN